MASDYQQFSTVTSMHGVPRFGHPSSIALLASNDRDQQNDYVHGVLAFSIFLLTLIFVWGTLILIFKFLGSEKVGCAAGGQLVDIQHLRKEKKSLIRSIVRRSWRLQITFFAAAILLSVASGLFFRNGLVATGTALDEIQQINDDIEAIAYRAIGITQSLGRAREKLQASNVDALLDIDAFCPLAHNNSFLINMNLTLISGTIRNTYGELNDFLKGRIDHAQIALETVSKASGSVDDAIDWYYQNDWLAKMYVMVLNVINFFLLVGLFLSRNNIVHYPYRRLLAYFLVPVLVILLVAAAIATSGFGIVTVMNADFCAGGESPGSPEGTIEDIIINHGIKEADLVYKSFLYYMNGCTSENPLAFIAPYQVQIDAAIDAVKSITSNIGNYGIEVVSRECGADISPVAVSIVALAESLDLIKGNLLGALELSGCNKISPVLRRVFYGPPCTDTVNALTWMFSSMLAISILSLVMLSVRASLYNATVRPDKALSHRAVEREWKEYKEFMSEFYPDAVDWKLKTSPVKKGDEVQAAASFDTSITAKPSSDSDSPGERKHEVLDSRYAHNHSDDNEPVITPLRTVTRTTLDDFEFSYRTRDLEHVLDNELVPLTPSPMTITVTTTAPPWAPKKSIARLRRSNLGQLC